MIKFFGAIRGIILLRVRSKHIPLVHYLRLQELLTTGRLRDIGWEPIFIGLGVIVLKIGVLIIVSSKHTIIVQKRRRNPVLCKIFVALEYIRLIDIVIVRQFSMWVNIQSLGVNFVGCLLTVSMERILVATFIWWLLSLTVLIAENFQVVHNF